MATQNGWCVWITGLPGSGKSVVSKALQEGLRERNIPAQILSSDALRKAVTPNPTYSEEERDMFYGLLVLVAEHLTGDGRNLIIDATGNRRQYREQARDEIPRFMEAYLKCSLDVCIERESRRGKTFQAPKDIYKRALEGEAPTVPGIGVPYEEPLDPQVTVDSEKLSPEECAQKIYRTMAEILLGSTKPS
ncbi:adenylyl-sulfate kinase [Candidatus Bathyarchaeota archaeon]|nr:adenylyl-sulfate kinase [Candidatus Bathyarchaeota archaeon]NIU80681.1 adenylyl-sulfate kinase [Candidatus Bathyarchaeota archaeon]NIV67302.1 adenylyl-sulfate kinase [Candidatus Bathyarchaeota archaeon]NIW15863.1 adenylyl-sulfate kinase [Candidatus Bathyarchaeota archaeon]NIW33974.1 adenylyl-sulfate kinase [Candidatus Bathyarchaeota archaeon]